MGGNQSHILAHASQKSTHRLHQSLQKQRVLWFDTGKIQTFLQNPQTWNRNQSLSCVEGSRLGNLLQWQSSFGLCCSSTWSCLLGKGTISDNVLKFRKEGYILVTTSLCIKYVTLEVLQSQEWGLPPQFRTGRKNTNLDFIPGLTSTVLSELATTLTKTSPASGWFWRRKNLFTRSSKWFPKRVVWSPKSSEWTGSGRAVEAADSRCYFQGLTVVL